LLGKDPLAVDGDVEDPVPTFVPVSASISAANLEASGRKFQAPQ